MRPHRPIATDSRFLAAVAGQRHVVARPTSRALDACERAQRELRRAVEGLDVVYPAPHLTLLSFASGTELREVQAAVRVWASRTRPFFLDVDGVATFPPPHRVVYVPVRASEGLERATRRLAREARARELEAVAGEAGGRTDWVWHVSLAYCDRLDPGTWRRAVDAAARLTAPAASCRIDAVEVVSYEADGEHQVGVYGLLGGRRGT